MGNISEKGNHREPRGMMLHHSHKDPSKLNCRPLLNQKLTWCGLRASPDDLPYEGSNVDEREKIAREVTGIEKD